jgi:hypothetical protein
MRLNLTPIEGAEVIDELFCPASNDQYIKDSVKSKAKERKATPVFSGVLRYFPDALKEVAKCSKAGQDQHNPDKPLAWDRSKSGDELDALTRHLIDHSVDPVDDDGVLHLAKVAWRSLAALQKHLEGQEV